MKPLIIILTIVILGNSCKKEENTTAETLPTKTEMITANDWKITTIKMSPGVMGFTDASYFIEDCVKDNIYRFVPNGTTIMNEGKTKCDSTSAQEIQEGTWAFNKDETEIIFLDNEFLGSTNLVKLTDSELILSKIENLPDTSLNGFTIPAGEQTINITFVH